MKLLFTILVPVLLMLNLRQDCIAQVNKKRDACYFETERGIVPLNLEKIVKELVKFDYTNNSIDRKIYCKLIVTESGAVKQLKFFNKKNNYTIILDMVLPKILFAPKITNGKVVEGPYYLTIHFSKNKLNKDFSLNENKELIIPINN